MNCGLIARTRSILIPLVMVGCVAWALGQSAAPGAAIRFGTPLNLPQASEGARQTEVNACVDANGRIHVVWIEEAKKGRDLYYALLDPVTNQISAPVKIRDTRGDVQPGARVRVDSEGAIYVVWSETTTAPGSEIRLAVSTDAGKTFARSIRVSDNPRDKAALMPAIALDRSGIYVTWLDSRNYAGPQKGADLYYALSTDGGRSFSQFTSLFSHVCDCYQDIATSQKYLIVVFRSAVQDIRDILLRASIDGGHTFPGLMRVSVDNWRTNQSPETGAQAVLDRNERLNVVWFSGKENQGDIYFSRSVEQNNTTSFEPKRRVSPWGEGKQTMPAIALDAKERITIAWQDGRQNGKDASTDTDADANAKGKGKGKGKGKASSSGPSLQRIYVTQSSDQGTTFPEPVAVPVVHEGANQNYSPIPCLLTSPDGSIWLAWTETLKKEQTAHLVKATVEGQ